MLVFNNKIVLSNNKWIDIDVPPPHVGAFTIRLKFSSGYTPVTYRYGSVWTQVDAENNIWDLTYNKPNWTNLLDNNQSQLLEVIEANTTGVTNMYGLFNGCRSLTKVVLFDTSAVTDTKNMFMNCELLESIPPYDLSSTTCMQNMFRYCESLKSIPAFNTPNNTDLSNTFEYCYALETLPLLDSSNVTFMYRMCFDCRSLKNIPLFNTSKVTNMTSAFYRCYKVESGTLSLYQQASSQTTPPIDHDSTFFDCGRDTTTGAAELAQIPWNWK